MVWRTCFVLSGTLLIPFQIQAFSMWSVEALFLKIRKSRFGCMKGLRDGWWSGCLTSVGTLIRVVGGPPFRLPRHPKAFWNRLLTPRSSYDQQHGYQHHGYHQPARRERSPERRYERYQEHRYERCQERRYKRSRSRERRYERSRSGERRYDRKRRDYEHLGRCRGYGCGKTSMISAVVNMHA